MNSIELWVCKEISALDPSFLDVDEDKRLTEDIFESGRLDSMQLMTLLLEAEAEFKISFTAESFIDRRIQYISGLAEVIMELGATQC